jgi:FkbM family methyltransferase
MPGKDRLKSLALRLLPEGLLQHLRKLHYARKLRAPADAGEPDLAVVRHLVPAGSWAVDVGANFGVYTKALSELVGPWGKVFSVEPVPLTFDVLASNVRRLRLDNVQPLNFAVSGGNGAAVMEVPRYGSGGENFYEARIVGPDGGGALRRVTVECRTLDALFADAARPISFVKCDVEGHELNCLRGAEGLIRRCRPAWLVEVSGDPDYEPTPASELVARMQRLGYGVFWSDGRLLHPRRPGDRRTNYFFLTDKHLAMLPAELWPARALAA